MGLRNSGRAPGRGLTGRCYQGVETGKAPGAMEGLVPQVALIQQHGSAPSSDAESYSCRSRGDRQVDPGSNVGALQLHHQRAPVMEHSCVY